MGEARATRRKLTAIILTIAMILSCFAYIQADTAKAAEKKAPGGSAAGAIFYIAVDGDGDGTVTGANDAVYYYTLDEIKAVNQEQQYKFVNHGVTENVSVKGAKLKTLLDDTTGITWDDSWTIQYMEEDAFHASAANYKDTIGGLTAADGTGNGSTFPGPADTIIGYAAKTTYDHPDENNVNETEYSDFINYDRDMSYVRAYRQGTSANDSTLKMLNGVVISPSGDFTGECGYQVTSVDENGVKIANDKEILGFPAGIKWEAKPNADVPWATLTDTQKEKEITIGSDATQEVAFTFSENPFFEMIKDGTASSLKRSQINADSVQYPADGMNEGTVYEYFGYDKPMYIRYQGKELKDLIGTVPAGSKVYLIDANGVKKDITDTVDNYFVAEYYSQSKSSTNISNRKRTPLDYAHSVIIDKTSAPLEYSNDGADYNVQSGKKPLEYANAKIAIGQVPATVTGLKVKSSRYDRLALSWSKADGAASYEIYRAASAKGAYKKIATTRATSFTNGGLLTGTRYYYKVKAVSSSGIEAVFSAAKSGRTVLNAPRIKARRYSKRAIKVSWKKVPGARGYKVYRTTKKHGRFKKVATVRKTAFINKKLKKGKRYYYKVRAYRMAGKKTVYSKYSNIVNIKR
ncbi:MAG: fibronectin type III domain-containing protein [Anaerovoracaceae bacterium]